MLPYVVGIFGKAHWQAVLGVYQATKKLMTAVGLSSGAGAVSREKYPGVSL
jgi:hypothetical protein